MASIVASLNVVLMEISRLIFNSFVILYSLIADIFYTLWFKNLPQVYIPSLTMFLLLYKDSHIKASLQSVAL